MHNAPAVTATPSPALPASEPSEPVLDVLQAPSLSASGGLGVADATLLAAFHEILTTLARATGGAVLPDGERVEPNGDAADTPRVTKSVLTLVAQKACLLTGCASATVALLDESRETIEFAAAWGDDANDLAGSRVRASDTLAGNTARTGEPYWAFRPEAEPGATNGALPFVHSAAVVPIFLNGQPVGAVAALHKKNRLPFDGADLMTLSTLAASASVVIGSQAVRAERAQHKRELDVLYEAVRNVSGALSAPDVLRVVVEQVAGQMESSAVVVWLLSDDRAHLSIAEDEGLTPDEREIVLPTTDSASSAGWISALLRQSRPVFLRFDDDDAQALAAGRGDFWTCESPFPALSARSGIACPIRSGDTVRGFVLVLSIQAPGVYQAPDAKLLSALASQAAVALENADLYEDATRREREAAALYDLSQTVTASLPLHDVMRQIGEAVLRLLDVDTFVLFLHDPPTDTLRIYSELSAPPGLRDQYAPLMGQGIPGWVMEFETPTSVPDVTRDPRNASAPLDSEGIASLIAAPLQIGAATIGVLCAMTFAPRAFTVAEMELAYTIANQAALAIENARIRESVRQNESQNRKFFSRLARALNAGSEPNDVPRLIVSQALEVLEADRCALWAVAGTGETQAEWLEKSARLGFRAQSDAADQSGFAANPNTLAGWIARNNHSLVIENVNTDDRFAQTYDQPEQGTVAAYLGVPVRLGGRVIGVLELFMRRRRKWKREEERLLLGFAAQAAPAFHNARRTQADARAAARAACLERLRSLSDHRNGASVGPDAIVAVLALHLNTPVVVLLQNGPGVSWESGAASGAPDALPQETLRAALVLLENATADIFTTNTDFVLASRSPAKSVRRGAAVVALQTVENGRDLQPLLNAAVELLTTPNEAETPRVRRTSNKLEG